MASAEKRNFDSPDEVRTPDKSRLELVKLGGATVGRATFQPGWRWSECIKPVVGGDSCQAEHLGVIISGRLGARHEDGTEVEVGPGEVFHIDPGHEGWVIGDEPVVSVEFQSESAATYAKP